MAEADMPCRFTSPRLQNIDAVHVIKDEGHFTSPTRAAGILALSVAL
jgi:hypothetical protein